MLQSLNQKVTSLEPTHNSDGFQLSSYAATQQKRMAARCNRVVTGCGKSNSMNGAPSWTKNPLSLGFIHQQLQTYSYSGSSFQHFFSLQQVSKHMSKCKSFRLTVPISEFNKLLDGALWSEGISVRRFVPPRSGSSKKQIQCDSIVFLHLYMFSKFSLALYNTQGSGTGCIEYVQKMINTCDFELSQEH